MLPQALKDQDPESFELLVRAQSAFAGCKQALAASTLDGAIFLLREVLDPQLSHPNALRSQTSHLLSKALLIRFTQASWVEDLEEAINLLIEMAESTISPSSQIHGVSESHNNEVTVQTAGETTETGKQFEMIKPAIEVLSNFRHSLPILILDDAICLYRQALLVEPLSLPKRFDFLCDLAAVLVIRFQASQQLQDLHEAIGLFREALDIPPSPGPVRFQLLLSLCAGLCIRFSQTGRSQDIIDALSLYDMASKEDKAANDWFKKGTNLLETFNQLSDLDLAVSLLRDSARLRPLPHLQRGATLNNLAYALGTRFEQTGQSCDLEEAIAVHRQVLALRPAPHPDRSTPLNNLASALSTRFDQKGQQLDLEEAIKVHREALQLTPSPHPHRSLSLNNLAGGLTTRFAQTGQTHDLTEAIECHREALKLRPVPHPDRAMSLSNLATAIFMQFEQNSQLDDLEEAIALHREALELRPAHHPYRSNSLHSLAQALLRRFKQSGQRKDLEDAITAHRKVLELRTEPHPKRPAALNSLALSLLVRFEQSGQLPDLEEVISFHRHALELRPLPHPDGLYSLCNLASAHYMRFREMGELPDLEYAILYQRQALELFPTAHAERPSVLNNLANTLYKRFEQTGLLRDLEEAIELHREALKLTPASHCDRFTSLVNLASTLCARFKRQGQLHDVEEAIVFHRNALELTPAPHPDRSTSLSNLATSLFTTFQETGQLGDLQEAIDLHRQALELRPAPHPGRFDSLNNLANVLSGRFEETHQLHDLEEAITCYREAIGLLPVNHPNHCRSRNLALVFMKFYSVTKRPELLEDAMTAFRAAASCESSPNLERIYATRNWAWHATESFHPSAFEAYQRAMNLLPTLVALDMDLQARTDGLKWSLGLACNAASFAIQAEKFEEAIVFLEEGRSIFWSQALQLLTPLDRLRRAGPTASALAEKLQTISSALEKGSLRNVSRNINDPPQRATFLEKEASYFRRLNDEWQQTLDEVRKLDGFRDFLHPKSFRALQAAAIHGPVVLLNASSIRCCDALILTLKGVMHVPLSDFTFKNAQDLVQLLQVALSSSPIIPDVLQESLKTLNMRCQDRLKGLRVPDSNHLQDPFQFILVTLWTFVVHPVINSLHLEKSESPSRLWWCPTGPFAFLPIHAAGAYGTNDSESVSDYVISSYTPTPSALLVPLPRPTGSFKMIVAIQPYTPGQRDLPFTVDELQKIKGHVANGCLVELGTPEAPISVDKVLSHLSNVSIAHFACHGEQNLSNPLDSALLLTDGPLAISRIMERPLLNASLAFLSACQTALGDEMVPDEAMHIAATMLFVGFRGVVGTMWPIDDKVAPSVADSFYRHIVENGPASSPDTTQSARALHLAVKKLRAEKNSPRLWAPFIHLGL